MTERTPHLSTPRPRTEVIASFEAAKRELLASGRLRYRDGFDMTQEERDKAAKSGAAMPDGGYPITTCTGDNSVQTAIHAVGRGNANHDAIRRHIIKRAKSLGCSSLIPDNWNADGSLQASAFATPDAPPVIPDDKVTEGATALLQAVETLKAEQAQDPDDTTDPNDVKVSDLIDQLDTIAEQLVKAQATDRANDPDSPASDVPTKPCPNCNGSGQSDEGTACPMCAGSGKVVDAKPAPTMNPSTVKDAAPAKLAVQVTKPTDGPINPVDELGNVDPSALCATPGCGHVASVHANTDTGDNTGECATPGCQCTGMTFPTNQGSATITGDDGEEVATPDNEDQGKMAALFAQITSDPALPVIIPADSTVNEAPAMVDDGTMMGAPFVIPCGIVEGQMTDDGRSIAAGALTWLNPPLPLMGQATSTHDPDGYDLNAPAVLCGRIDALERVPGENGTQLITAKGFFLPDEDGDYYADKVRAMGRVGVSADVKVFETAISAGELDEYGFPMDLSEIVTSGEISAFTIVPGPAFPQCYIAIDEGPIPEPIPVQSDENSPMAASAQLVHFIAEEVCEPCEAMDVIDPVVAGGFAPMRPPKAWFDNPNFTLGDGRLVEIFTGRGVTRLGGRYACPLTITDDGEVYGHIAPWDVCHTGMKGTCVTAPHSKMGYAQFMRAGQQVVTAEGERVTVGVLTFDTGHANQSRNMRNYDVQRHYDDTGTAFADVVAGEDEYGVWVHGALRPNITELQLRAIRAASPSGDWRECGGNLELMAILQVNDPGFPVAVVAGGSVKSLVAAGAVTMRRLGHEVEEFDDEDRDALLRMAVKPMLRLVTDDARGRLDQFVLERTDEARKRLARL